MTGLTERLINWKKQLSEIKDAFIQDSFCSL